jgi:hypothetical protein
VLRNEERRFIQGDGGERGFKSQDILGAWLAKAKEFVHTLPSKG